MEINSEIELFDDSPVTKKKKKECKTTKIMYYSYGPNSRRSYIFWVYRTVMEGNFSFHIMWKISAGDFRPHFNETILHTFTDSEACVYKFWNCTFRISTFKTAFLESEIFSILKLKLLHWTSYCLWKSKIFLDSR